MAYWSHRRSPWRRGFGVPLALAAIALAPPAYAQDVSPPGPPPPPPSPIQAPVPAPGALPVSPRNAEPAAPAEVRFEPETPDLALLRQTGERSYRHVTRFASVQYDIRYYERRVESQYAQVCAGPCTTELVPGEYALAISKNGRSPVPAEAVRLDGPSTVQASYDDRRGLRILGGVILAVGVGGGVSLIVVSAATQTCNGGGCSSNFNGTIFGASIGIIAAAAIAGTLLASMEDTAHVSVTPLTIPSPMVGALKESLGAALGAAPPQGAALTYRF
jgi:hypothetical protein